MGILSGAQKHVNCFEQDIKYFYEIFLARGGHPFVFSIFEARFDGWHFASFIKSI